MKIVMRAFSLLVLCASSAWSIAEDKPATEIQLSSKEYIIWSQGQYFDLCDQKKSHCLTMKMPKGLIPIDRLSYATNMADARATWLAHSGKNNFICAVLPNSGAVTCGKVLNAPQVNNASAKSKKLIAQQSFAETKAVLAGELAMARYHSSWSTANMGVTCTDCEAKSNDITSAYNECLNAADNEYMGNESEDGNGLAGGIYIAALNACETAKQESIDSLPPGCDYF